MVMFVLLKEYFLGWHCLMSFTFRFSFVFVILFTMAGCSGVQTSGSEVKNWHQYYEPAESWESVNFAYESFAEAIRFYGPSAVPVREINIRQSVKRRHPARFSRADIVDWHKFVSFLVANRDAYPLNGFWESLSSSVQASMVECSVFGKTMPLAKQLLVVDDLNRLVQSPSFYDPSYYSSFIETHPSLSKLAARYHKLKGKKVERFNRRLISAMFPATLILPFRERRRVTEGIELCEVADPVAGRVVLYVSSPEMSPQFYLQLAHETMHLLNPSIYDWYMEGLGSVFAEHMAAIKHLDWRPWQKRFASRRKSDPYAISYFMMREIVAVAGDDMGNFLQFAFYSGQPGGEMRLDVESWLAGLNQEKQKRILAILKRYGPQINKHRGQRNALIMPTVIR